jgi:hypothetical protein
MNSLPIRNYLSEHAAAAGLDFESIDGPLGTPEHLLHLIFSRNAKLPLDKVPDVAALAGCDVRSLFRVALSQFYSDDTIQLLERMLATREESAG